MDGSPGIEATDVRKTYGETTALDGVSLAVPPGEVFALVGPNGAGKTTVVRCLTGTTTADGGTVSLLGARPWEVNADRIGLLPQNFDPYGRLSARELIEYYAGLYDAGRDPDEVVSAVGLEDVATTKYEDLSGGEQRRTLVGTTIVNEPDVLFLDEPTTGIDPAGRRDVWRLIEDLASGGTTVFMTTHYMAEVNRLADRVGVLSDGELVAIDTPHGLVSEHGGGPELVISTDVSTIPGFRTEPSDHGLRLPDVPLADVGSVVERLHAENIEVTSLTWRDPDLETVYLSLTGQDQGNHATPRGDLS